MINPGKVFDIIVITSFLGAAVRQVISFSSMIRASLFLKCSRILLDAATPADSPELNFVIAVPVCKEQLIIEETVSYFSQMAFAAKAKLIFITCEREMTNVGRDGEDTTVDFLQKLQHRNSTQFIHLHLPDAEGVKSDQLNYFVDMFTEICPELDPKDTFVLIYDADSRPDPDSLRAFRNAILLHCHANVFQQSSLFWPNYQARNRISNFFSACAALRASRFVFAYELPRLIGRMRFREGHRDLLTLLSKVTYSHVTGHGLCIRLSFLKKQPFSARTVMEDMNYGFRMCCLGETVIPVAFFDNAQVPATLRESFRQACRWFLGPARSLSYLVDPYLRLTTYSVLVAISAVAISLEWLSCAVFPVLFFIGFSSSEVFIQISIGLFGAIYLATCIYTAHLCERFGLTGLKYSILVYPIVCTVFGLAGFFGLFYLLFRQKKFLGQTTKKSGIVNPLDLK